MLLIQGGTVKPISGPDLPNGQVLIDNGKIVAVGTNLEVPEGTEVYHAEGCLITPGLMDAHTHIGLDEEAIRWEGADYNEMSDPVTPNMRGIDGINPQDEAFTLALQGGAYGEHALLAIEGEGQALQPQGKWASLTLSPGTVVTLRVKLRRWAYAPSFEEPFGAYDRLED